MRILAITDTHGDLDSLEKAIRAAGMVDAILVLGDVGVTRTAIRRVYRRLSETGIRTYVIHGNHEDEDVAHEVASEYGLRFVHRGTDPLDDFVVIGYGGDGFSLERDDLDSFSSALPGDIAHRCIVMTHAPPSNTVLDDLDGDHVGDASVRRLIERTKPLVALSGHLHENFHEGGTLGDTIIANPGDTGTLVIINPTAQGYAVSLKRL